MKDFSSTCRFGEDLDKEGFPLSMNATGAGSSLIWTYHSTINSFTAALPAAACGGLLLIYTPINCRKMRKLCVFTCPVSREVPIKSLSFQEWETPPHLLLLPRAKPARAARFITIFAWAQTFRHLHERLGLLPFAFGPQGMKIDSSASSQDHVLPHG